MVTGVAGPVPGQWFGKKVPGVLFLEEGEGVKGPVPRERRQEEKSKTVA